MPAQRLFLGVVQGWLRGKTRDHHAGEIALFTVAIRGSSKIASENSWSLSSSLKRSAQESRWRSRGETLISCAVSSSVYHDKLMPESSATSSLRNPGTRRRPMEVNPTSSGVKRARHAFRNSRSSSLRLRFSALEVAESDIVTNLMLKFSCSRISLAWWR
jgi:hypothetical protein